MEADDTALTGRLERIVVATDPIEADRLRALVKARLLEQAPAELRIDRFVVLGPLGVGGMGIVYAAYDPELDRKVAIKLVRTWGIAEREEDRERLVREARALAKLSHPNVVPIYEVGLHAGTVFIAMEFVRGETLREHVKRHTGWRDVVRVYLQAAEGLAAAHDVGLVHRDFKPDNAIVGEDGRVRVVDFGLARGEGPSERGTTPAEMLGDTNTPLTRTGSLVGTPAYMAPEQRLGLPVQPSGDQFGFCASLHEALAGATPSHTLTDVTLALPTALPARLRRVLARGLALSPDDRYPSMRALITDLRATMDTHRRVRITAAVALTVGVGAGLAMAALDRDACPDPSAELTGTWDAARRDELLAAAETIGAVPGIAAEITADELDRRAQAWTAARRDTCEALYVRRTDSQALFDRRMRCLDRRRDAMASLVDELGESDAAAWEHAVEAAVDLAPIESCAEVEKLGVEDDAFDPAAIEALRTRIDRAQTLERLGRLGDAEELVAAIVEDALTLGHRPTEAEALRSKGVLLAAQARDVEATPVLADAAWRADAGRADELAADILAKLMALEAGRGNVDVADALALRVQGALERLGRASGVEIQVLRARHALALVRSRFDEAEEHARAGLQLSIERRGIRSLDAARDLNNLGLVQYERGDFAAARESLTTALEIKREWLGAAHPDVIFARTNVASVDEREGHTERARAELESAIADAERSLVPSPVLAGALVNLAKLHLDAGRDAEALPLAQRAVAVLDETVGADDPRLITALLALGYALSGAQRTDDERACYERALAVADRIDPDHPQKAYLLNNLAQIDLGLDDAEAAREKSRRALALWTRTNGAEHPVAAQLEYSLAMAEIELGADADAATHARHAIGVLARGGPVDAPSLAGAQFLLARVLARGPASSGAEAIAAAEAALAGYETLGDADQAVVVRRFVEERTRH